MSKSGYACSPIGKRFITVFLAGKELKPGLKIRPLNNYSYRFQMRNDKRGNEYHFLLKCKNLFLSLSPKGAEGGGPLWSVHRWHI